MKEGFSEKSTSQEKYIPEVSDIPGEVESHIPPPPVPSEDQLLPPTLKKTIKRLSNDLELYKLHVKHYHMSTRQLRIKTSELALPEEMHQK